MTRRYNRIWCTTMSQICQYLHDSGPEPRIRRYPRLAKRGGSRFTRFTSVERMNISQIGQVTEPGLQDGAPLGAQSALAGLSAPGEGNHAHERARRYATRRGFCSRNCAPRGPGHSRWSVCRLFPSKTDPATKVAIVTSSTPKLDQQGIDLAVPHRVGRNRSVALHARPSSRYKRPRNVDRILAWLRYTPVASSHATRSLGFIQLHLPQSSRTIIEMDL